MIMKSTFRNMRLLLFFDLPSVELYEKKEYLKFRKSLLKNGYIMLQFSVYIKSINTSQKINGEIKKIKNELPNGGNIRIVQITESQYENMFILIGNKKINEIYNNSERYIKI
ncbi:MAG: CRISPR-associated endonuclease Cas2 [Metamycoplasmataceae bacterium]